MRLSVIIAAGGTGERMGAGGSKQLMLLAGEPVLYHTIAIFDPLPAVNEIIIAIEPDDIESCRSDVVQKGGFAKVSSIVAGGGDRTESVGNALSFIDDAADTVIIHDGARPLFPADLLALGLETLQTGTADGVVFGTPVTDTIKQVGPAGLVEATPDRDRLWAAQTPQIFRREIIEKAYAGFNDGSVRIGKTATDDASLVESLGGRVQMIQGSGENIKLTTPVDIELAEAILASREGQA